VRIVPVAIALIGAGQDRATVGLLGWLGPRGLAAVAFAMLTLDELGGSDGRVLTVVDTVTVTVVLSVVVHGFSARPLVARYVSGRAGLPSR
jgi:NhaP-type Na+/H+ or K+/H+ antiporter